MSKNVALLKHIFNLTSALTEFSAGNAFSSSDLNCFTMTCELPHTTAYDVIGSMGTVPSQHLLSS